MPTCVPIYASVVLTTVLVNHVYDTVLRIPGVLRSRRNLRVIVISSRRLLSLFLSSISRSSFGIEQATLRLSGDPFDHSLNQNRLPLPPIPPSVPLLFSFIMTSVCGWDAYETPGSWRLRVETGV